MTKEELRGAVTYVRSWPWMVWFAGINCGILLGTVQTWRDTGNALDFLLVLPAAAVMQFIAIKTWEPKE